jgi:hypothetical protein
VKTVETVGLVVLLIVELVELERQAHQDRDMTVVIH